jgi:hypothetical protein
MSLEEGLVFDALRGWSFDPSKATILDFVPTRILFELYRAHAREFDYTASEEAVILNATQFGVALRRVFDISGDRRTRCLYAGRREVGYRFVKGPGSIVTQLNRGRPKKCRIANCISPAVTPPI